MTTSLAAFHRLRRLLPCLALALALPAGARAEGEVRFAIRPGGKGPQRLDVPPAFLSASAAGDLADLRLVDAAGREVPYLLVTAPDQEPDRWVDAVHVRPIPATKAESGFELDLGAVVRVGMVELDLPGAGYLKKARLEGSADGRRWVVLVPEAVLFRLPVEAKPDDPRACGGAPCPAELGRGEVGFPARPLRYLRVVLDDRGSPRAEPPVHPRALVVRATAPAAAPAVPLAVAPIAGEPRTSRFALRLPGLHLPVRAVILHVDAPRLSRRARVLEPRLAGGRLAPLELGATTLLATAREGVPAPALRIPVSPPEGLELELAVDDADNPPLALTAAHVELAPLPWIFFESKDGAPVEARLGDRARAAPRYDLEALRPQIERLRPAQATATVDAAIVHAATRAATVPGAALAGAAVDPKAFRFDRAIAAGEPGLTAVRLDAHVLARSPSLADLRVVGPDGRQLPYLLERRDEPLPVPLEERPPATGSAPPRELAGPGLTLHELHAPSPLLPEGQLVLETAARVFTRRVQVWARPEGLKGAEGERVAEAIWAHADPDRAAPPLAVELPRLAGARIVVAVKDGDNAALRLSAARVLLPGYRLRFFHPGAPLRLLYGAALPAPQYDLALLAPRLRAAGAREVALGPVPGAAEGAAGGTGPGEAMAASPRAVRVAFWLVLGAAVLGLLALVARLLARGGAPPPAG